IVKWKGFGDVIRSLGEEFARLAIKMLLIRPLTNWLTGVLGAIFPWSAPVPGRASGGPVWPGQAFMVGERGPELFMPATAGQVVSQSGLRGGGGQIVYNIDARGADAGVEHRVRRALERMRAETTAGAVSASRDLALRGA
ncbi:MAG: hypothetical protein AAB368_16970, partial [bacterium]